MGAPFSTWLRYDFADGLEGWEIRDPAAQLTRWLGREALMLSGGLILAPAAPEPAYTIRALVSGGPSECFIGFCFHVADNENYETVYLAPHAGADPAAIQYDPVINGSNTWQVFGDADGLGDAEALARAPLRPEHWHKLRLDVWPQIARVYVDDSVNPFGTFPLRSGRTGGRVGLWGYLPSYVANFEVAPLQAPEPSWSGPKAVRPTGTVNEWLVAGFDPAVKRLGDGRLAPVEHNGVLCLNRLYRAEPGSRAVVACDIEIPAGADQAALEIGYSDQVRVWWRGELVHAGKWCWDPGAGTDGRIRPGQVVVPLSPGGGRGPLVVEVAIAEPSFGWGLTARVTADGAPCRSRSAERIEVPMDLL